MAAISRILLPREIARALHSLTEGLQIEVCGALNGKLQGEVLRILGWRACQNVAHSASECAIDVNELLAAPPEPHAHGDRLIGVFHSHLNEAFLSQVDHYFLSLSPFVWAIIGASSRQEMPIIRFFKRTGVLVTEICCHVED